jgi:hypothetical protein
MVALNTPMGLELHEWNGVAFSLVPAPVMPPASGPTVTLSYWNFTYDEVRGKLVVFGVWVVGLFNAGPLPQTWEWDPVNGWVDLGMSGTLGGTPRTWFDRQRGRVMRWDETNTGSQFFVREPTGTWTAMPTVIPVRLSPWPCYDPKRNRLYGTNGWLPGGLGYFSDAQPATFDQHAPGCPASLAPTLALSLPWTRAWGGGSLATDIGNLGSPFAILTMGFGDQLYNGNPLPLALASHGMPGCTLNIEPTTSLVLPAVNGTATATIPIPNTAALYGQPFYQQAFAAVPGANPLGVLASDSMRGTVGRFQ